MRKTSHLRYLLTTAAVVAMVGVYTPAIAQTMTWPRQLTAPEGTIDVYQPQLETLKGNMSPGVLPSG
jgi:hypothetical protein